MDPRSSLIRLAHANPELRPDLLPFLRREPKTIEQMAPQTRVLIDAEREFIAALTRVYMRGGLGRGGMARAAYGAALRAVERIVQLAMEVEQETP